jgi:hypothetical protein
VDRRAAYEADEDYNEYVWLGNVVTGNNYDKERMDAIISSVNPSWSLYKQFKTCKLAMNFGMGVQLFAVKNGLTLLDAKRLFNKIHDACPAIRRLQKKVEYAIRNNGYVQDPFGHIYAGNSNEAYKIVAYLIQGCGTGSIPKAMARSVFETIHTHLATGSGVMTGIIHDEITFRIRVYDNPLESVIKTLEKCLYNCEEQFSPLFDNIPLRAKLYLSVTNAAEAKEIKHHGDYKSVFNDAVAYYYKAAAVNIG